MLHYRIILNAAIKPRTCAPQASIPMPTVHLYSMLLCSRSNNFMDIRGFAPLSVSSSQRYHVHMIMHDIAKTQSNY